MKKLSIYEQVTNKIISEMEKGTTKWFAPWDSNGAHHNGASKHVYKGINVLLTFFAAAEHGYSSNEWFTFNQAKTLGASINKGSKATKIVAFSVTKYDEEGNRLPEDTPDDQVHRVRPFAKWISIFNRDQVEGLPEKEQADSPCIEVQADISSSVNKYLDAEGIELIFKGDEAYYSRTKDLVCLPDITRFHSTDGYWATLMHELAHSTGHKDRLNRAFGTFGSPEYAFEELVAELASSFMCSRLGLSGDLEGHASYLNSWIELLKNDDKAIFKASALAEKATKYIFEHFAEDQYQDAA